MNMLEFGNCESRLNLMYRCGLDEAFKIEAVEHRDVDFDSVTSDLKSSFLIIKRLISIKFKKLSRQFNEGTTNFRIETQTIKQSTIKNKKNATKVKPIKNCKTPNEYLTLDEINNLLRAGQVPDHSKAEVSRMVGLGWDDIERLMWEEIELSGKKVYRISFKKDKSIIKDKYTNKDSSNMSIQELQEENMRLRQMYMDLSLEHKMLKDSIDKKIIRSV